MNLAFYEAVGVMYRRCIYIVWSHEEADMKAFTRFSMWGNSIAVRIPGNVAREAGIVEGAAAELSVVNGALVVSPLDVLPAYKLDDLVSAITDENLHGEIGTGSAQGNEFA